jgi:hypothetical protein
LFTTALIIAYIVINLNHLYIWMSHMGYL